jgi:hypothetical protein
VRAAATLRGRSYSAAHYQVSPSSKPRVAIGRKSGGWSAGHICGVIWVMLATRI